jgi:hypothetical protein
MWFTRAARFNVGIGNVVGSTGWSVPASIRATTYALTSSSARKVRLIQTELAYLEDNGYAGAPGNLDLALRSFNSTYDRFPSDYDSQLVDTVTAAEAMLAAGALTELTFKLSFRVAGLLGRTSEERLQIFGSMKGFYDVRSKTVHGDQLRDKQWRILKNVDEDPRACATAAGRLRRARCRAFS